MNLCKRVISVICIVTLLLSNCNNLVISANTNEAEVEWEINVSEIIVKDILSTTKIVQLYDGSEETVLYENIPGEGNSFVIAALDINKKIVGAGAASLSDLSIVVDGVRYKRMEDDLFLNNHHYTALGDTELVSTNGYVCFEIPSIYANEMDYSNIYFECGNYEITHSLGYDSYVAMEENVVDSMATIDEEIKIGYNFREDKSLDNVYVIKNPYGNAPLTAYALFETEEICDVTVTVKGKNGAEDISYEINDNTYEHHIGIYGLYAGYKNEVVIKAGEVEKTIYINTDPLPEKITQIGEVYQMTVDSQLNDQLILLQDGWYTMIDNAGEIRWYIDEKWHTTSVSGAFTFNEDNTGIWFSLGAGNGSPYRNGAMLIHMNWFGKVMGLYTYEDYCAHHDATIMSDGDLLYWGSHDDHTNKLLKLDSDTGEVTEFLDLNEVSWLDSSVGNIDAEAMTNEDWAHPNSVEYVEEYNCLLMSLRNQHMLVCYDLTTQLPLWVLTPASKKDEKGKITALQKNAIPYIIVPNSKFEWFYCQHDISYVSGSGNSMEITLFDNGSFRYISNGIDESLDDGSRYSRIVKLKVDWENKAVKTVFEYGKNRGIDLYSRTFGSTQFIEENGHYLGAFRCMSNSGSSESKILEVNTAGKVVASYSVGNIPEGLYQATAVRLQGLNFQVLLENTGIEIHQYNQPNWLEEEMPQTNAEITNLVVDELSANESSFTINGSAKLDTGYKVADIKVYLVNNESSYSFSPVLCRNTTGLFYGTGINVEELPNADFSIYVSVTDIRGNVGCAKLKEIFRNKQVNYTSENVKAIMPDQKQEQTIEALTMEAVKRNLDNAYVKINPFGTAPLTAIIAFSTDKLASARVVVKGHTEDVDVAYNVEGNRYIHKIPVWGLYYNDTTTVVIEMTDENGKLTTKSFDITTGESADGRIPVLEMEYTEESILKMAPGLTFCWPAGGCHPIAIDKYGDVRWYYTKQMGGIAATQTDEGHLLICNTDKTALSVLDLFTGIEIDLLGRIYNEYYIDGGFHHEYQQLSNGNLLIDGYKYGSATYDDYIVEMNPENGEIVRSWKMDEILGGVLEPNPSYKLPNNSDWFHHNATYYDEKEDTMIISSRHQNMVLKIDAETGEIIWILSDPEFLEGTHLDEYLLTPIEEGFVWQYGQHNAFTVDNGDLLMFDNGNYRSKNVEDSVEANDNYSRALRLRIDEEAMTVETVWEYGRNLGTEYFCNQVGGVEYYGNDHYLIDFGDHFKLETENGPISSDTLYTVQIGMLKEVIGDEAIWSVVSNCPGAIKCSAFARANRWNITSMVYDYDVADERRNIGSGPQTKQTEVNIADYVVTEMDYVTKSVINEGNRVIYKGNITEEDVTKVYIMYETKEGKQIYDATYSATTGDIASTVYWNNSAVPFEKYISLLVEKTSGEKYQIAIDDYIPRLDAYSIDVSAVDTLIEGERAVITSVISPVNAYSKSFTYKSETPEIVSVSKDGVVKGLKEGTGIITVKLAGLNVQSQIEIIVLDNGEEESTTNTEITTNEITTNEITTNAESTNEKETTWADKQSETTSQQNDNSKVIKKLKRVKIKKLVRKKKKIKVVWKKVKGADGYVVQYSSKKNFKNKKVKRIRNGKKNYVLTTKLKANRKYYFRVKCYKKVNKRIMYGKWSKIKRIVLK